MTTPKEPEYMFPAIQGLPEEFRRLAAEAQPEPWPLDMAKGAESKTWLKAAQMLEERLNG